MVIAVKSLNRVSFQKPRAVPQVDSPFGRDYVGPVLHDEDSGYDGRLLRGERTRLHIAEAMIDLIEEGNPKPTANCVAAKAGVSLRLVFHHFADVNAIFESAAAIQAGRHWRKLGTVQPVGPTSRRIDATVHQRRKLFEAISPVREAAMARASSDPVIAEFIQAGMRRLRDELSTTFAPELEPSQSDFPDLLDSIDLIASWDAWHSMRVNGRKSVTATCRIMKFSLRALLGATSASQPLEHGDRPVP